MSKTLENQFYCRVSQHFCRPLMRKKNSQNVRELQGVFRKISIGNSVWEESVPFVTSSIPRSRGRPGRLKDRERYEPGDKDEKYVNGTHISIGKFPPFQECRLFRKASSGMNQKVMFQLAPNRNFRNVLVNGKRSQSNHY